VTAVLRRARAAWDRYFFTPVPAEELGFARALFFSLAFLYYVPQDFGEWGTVAAEFWMPIALFKYLSLPLLPAATIDVIELIFKVALLLGAIGLATRVAAAVAFVCGVYLLGLPHNFGQIQHFDTLIVLVFGILTLSRAGDSWSIDAWRRAGVAAPSGEYRWPIRAIWVMTALIFFAAGFSKLRHSGLEWIFSDHLAILLVRHQYHVSDGEPLTALGPVIASYPWAARTLAAVSVFTELLFPLALFSTRARWLFVPAGLGFLVGIRLLMGPTFEAFVICFVFWVPWSLVPDRVSAAVRSRRGTPDRVMAEPLQN
jgi:uncharacterized membrane protein YphA (DoxX/SURF4 family)